MHTRAKILAMGLLLLFVTGMLPAAGNEREMEILFDKLADPSATADARHAIEEQIVANGRRAIEPLIGHLNDKREFERRKRLANENLMINAPANRNAPAPVYVEDRITIGDRCRLLLARIITPPGYRSPYESNAKPFELGGQEHWYFHVVDWPRWWQENKQKSLSQIRSEMKPVIDSYWKSHGVEQKVE